MLLLALPVAAPARRPAQEPAATTRPAMSDAEIDRLVDQLAHPRYERRESATRELCMLDPGYLPHLLQRYRTEPRYELKRRLRYVIETIFLRPVIAGRDGFMGIQVQRQVLPGVKDPATGKSVAGVMVERVLEGHAAERAGVKDGDLIVGIDGAGLPDDPTSESFIRMISGRSPGTVVNLRALRMRSEPRIIRAPAGAEPRRVLEGASLQFVMQGVRIVEVTDRTPAAALGLRPNDLLRTVNGKDLSGPNGAVVLDRTLGAAPAGSEVSLGLADVSSTEIQVTLGPRPLELMQPVDWNEARMRLQQWWLDHGGEPSARPGTPTSPMVMFRPMPPLNLTPETSVIP